MTRASLPAVRLRLAREDGLSMIELLMTLVVLAIVLGALTQLFVSATRAQVDLSNRFQAQQNVRLALDSLRREIHCAKGISPAFVASPANYPRSSITVTLPGACPSNTAALIGGVRPDQPVFWCTTGSGTRFQLIRTTTVGTCTGGPKKADFLTSGNVFTAYTAISCRRDTLSVKLPVNIKGGGTDTYTLQDDIVLRNTGQHC